MKVVFWGTPDFALPSLYALLESEHEVAGVVTQPDRPAGRGRVQRAPPVKKVAVEFGVPVLQPEKPRGPEFMAEFSDFEPEICVVAAYGQILRPEVLELAPLGFFNVHASLLPELRGAAPVNWAIIRGYEETGVTIMRMVEQMDAGPVLGQARCRITASTTAGELADQLARLGAAKLLEALLAIGSGQAEEREQNDADATYAPKLHSEDARLDWTRPAVELDRWIRGCDPHPAAWSELGDLRVKLFKPRVLRRAAASDAGVVEVAGERGLEIATGAGTLGIEEVQPAGKRRMSAADWIRGRGVTGGDRFC